MDLGLKGKRAAVAAGSAGLGYAVAKALIAEGVRVAICGRSTERLAAAATQLGAIPLVADLSDPLQAQMFVERAAAQLGGVDILVTNSGGPPVGNFESSLLADYESALQSNLLSAVAMCQAAVPAMKLRGWGRVVAITSLSARRPNPRVMMTGMARAGLTAMLKALSLEVAACGVTVNSLQPGPHRTARLEYLYDSEEEIAAAAQDVPMKAMGCPDDFGAVAAFLCSDQAKYITGTSLLVDGGTYPGLY